MSEGHHGPQGPADGAEARARNPHTTHAELYELARTRPDLRPLIAENPHTYPQLVQWLGQLGDPAVTAALQRRSAQGGEQPTQAIPQRSRPAEDQKTQAIRPADSAQVQANHQPAVAPTEQPTEAFGAVRDPYPAQHIQQTPAAAEQKPSFSEITSVGPPPYRDTQYAGTPGYAPQYSQQPPSSPYEQAQPRRRGGGACVLIFLLLLVLVAALAAAYVVLVGNPFTDDNEEGVLQENQQEDSSPPEEDTTEENDDEPEDDEAAEEELARPAPSDALEITDFSAPSGNISCQMDEGDLACTVLEYIFEGPDDCDGPVSVRMSAEGESTVECSAEVEIQQTALDYGSSTANAVFACESTETHMECWSQQSGRGFVLAREHVTTD